MSDTPTIDGFRRAFAAAVHRYRAMTPTQFLKAIQTLCNDSLIGSRRSVLKVLAKAGSIDAAAILLVLCDHKPEPDKDALAAIAAIVKRSEDIKNELYVSNLAKMLEEWGDEEVAAGRMTVQVDPTTGRKLYGSAKSEGSAS